MFVCVPAVRQVSLLSGSGESTQYRHLQRSNAFIKFFHHTLVIFFAVLLNICINLIRSVFILNITWFSRHRWFFSVYLHKRSEGIVGTIRVVVAHKTGSLVLLERTRLHFLRCFRRCCYCFCFTFSIRSSVTFRCFTSFFVEVLWQILPAFGFEILYSLSTSIYWKKCILKTWKSLPPGLSRSWHLCELISFTIAPFPLNIQTLWSKLVLFFSCDAEPGALAKYVLALLRKPNKSDEEMRAFSTDQLEVFLQGSSFFPVHFIETNVAIFTEQSHINFLCRTQLSLSK